MHGAADRGMTAGTFDLTFSKKEFRNCCEQTLTCSHYGLRPEYDPSSVRLLTEQPAEGIYDEQFLL